MTGSGLPARWVPPWDGGVWLNPPEDVVREGDDLLVTAVHGSDLWRTTAYGFVHDSGHALLLPLPDGTAAEVCFVVDYGEQFDQAGLLVRADAHSWIKAGVEVSDGELQVGAVVTRETSDWSLSPVPHWAGREVTMRASRSGDALTIRARVDTEPWQLVRVAPIAVDARLQVGPYCCAPTRSGLVVRFRAARLETADGLLHPG